MPGCTYRQLKINVQACRLQTHTGICELKHIYTHSHTHACTCTHTYTHMLTPRGDEGQTGLIVSSSRSREHIDFSHTPLSTHLPLTRSPPPSLSLLLLLSERTLHIFLSLLSPPRCPFLKPHFFFPNSSLSLLPLSCPPSIPLSPHTHEHTHTYTSLSVFLAFFSLPSVLNGADPHSRDNSETNFDFSTIV